MMRPLRLIFILTVAVLAAILLIYSRPLHSSQKQAHTTRQHEPMGAFFDWHIPSLLFPPTAVISLTDDNSTFFLARPARFGPALPNKSLSGPLWVGSGFGEDHFGRSWATAGWGELGCSDIPDWDGSNEHADVAGDLKNAVKSKNKRRGIDSDDPVAREATSNSIDDDDGTDDHLHPSSLLRPGADGRGVERSPHADIQSLQEGAEIAGKIVLLSRGGCGFLDKVKWAQRRGAVALIVGDDVRGAGLVTMYARGDTSNITIPSLFTSHTTAHLLASLIPSDLLQQDISPDDSSRLDVSRHGAGHVGDQNRKSSHIDRPNFTAAVAKHAPTSPSKEQAVPGKSTEQTDKDSSAQIHGIAWYKSALFGSSTDHDRDDGTRRPPSSGSLDWVPASFDKGSAADPKVYEDSPVVTTSAGSPSKSSIATPKDDFVIGVQDWRDPDLVPKPKEKLAVASVSPSFVSSVPPHKAGSPETPKLGGGSITPGSGEYIHNTKSINARSFTDKADDLEDSTDANNLPKEVSSAGWLKRIFSSGHGHDARVTKSGSRKSPRPVLPIGKLLTSTRKGSGVAHAKQHDGLWVTLTPTPASSSPFFDTLLVLVVSPLVTLTIVYALLILRSRIRRRRWRAPKSVVERLPVRTYQTMQSSPSSTTTTPVTSPRINVTTPLLASEARPICNDSRIGRARNEASSVEGTSLEPSDDAASLSSSQLEEKRSAGLAEWRRRYGGKQRECVVCLEEYVDGVSRVMSLPCGHEFHAECITPWLTTRRRTCPICKGDVVRSLARSAASTSGSFFAPSSLRFQDDTVEDDDVEVQPVRPQSRESASLQPANSSFPDYEHDHGR